MAVEVGEDGLEEVQDVLEALGTAVVRVRHVVAGGALRPLGQQGDLLLQLGRRR